MSVIDETVESGFMKKDNTIVLERLHGTLRDQVICWNDLGINANIRTHIPPRDLNFQEREI